MFNKLFLFSVFFLVSGCASQGKIIDDDTSILIENNALKSELVQSKERLKVLTNENNKLRKELDEILNGPSRLLDIAKKHIDNKDGRSAKISINKLLKMHPTSSEARKTTSLKAKAEKLILEEKKRIREEEKRVALKKHIYTSEDELEGITWYKAKLDKRQYKTRIVTYFGKQKSGSPWHRMKIRYYADDWLFISSFFVVVDGKRYTFKKVDFERDNGSGSIWEWNDRPVKKKELIMLKHIIDSDSAVVRFQGKLYHADYTITRDEKLAIQHVLDAFEQVKSGK